GDIWSDFDFATLPRQPKGSAHLVMVDNPLQHPRGDFILGADGQVHDEGEQARLTFAGIGVYRPQLLQDWQAVIGNADGAAETPPRFKLAPLLRAAMANNSISGQHHQGRWTDVGTPERLQQLDKQLVGAA
ncbi:MAG: nucleotidyltransferase family protein, partial [Stenotrophomonas sp.]